MTDAEILAAILPQLVDVRTLVPYEENSRTHTPAQIEQIKDSCRRFGFVGTIAYLPPDALKIGHARRQAAMEMWEAGEAVMGPGLRVALPTWHLPTTDLTGLSPEAVRALVIADNKLAENADWDEAKLRAEIEALASAGFDLPVLGFDPRELDRLINPPAPGSAGTPGAIAAEFLVPPFSVLNAREGWWQDRKRGWLALGIKSEIGRGRRKPDPTPGARGRNRRARGEGSMVPYDAGGAARPVRPGMATGANGQSITNHPRYYEQKCAAEERLGRTLTNEEFERDHWRLPDSEIASGTSIFDPVLCELVYRWFAPAGGVVLDPFAGGSVRGIVAAALGRSYLGVDLRPEQAAANRDQWPGVVAQLADQAAPEPRWTVGDSAVVVPDLDVQADLIFTCPPYGDLEVYSDDPADISNMDVEDFDKALAQIVAASMAKLRDHRFAVVVIGDYRDKRGMYRNLVSKTIAAFLATGAQLYNHAILVTSVGSLPIRAARQFRGTRKMGNTHQNVLCFLKGDAKKATAALGPVDVSAAMAGVVPDDDADPEPDAHDGRVRVKVSAASARQLFTTCGPDCIRENGCAGNCCDAPSRPTGCLVTIHPTEQARIEALGGVVEGGFLQPLADARGCPFKVDGLCAIHFTGPKPFGCIASPFTLNTHGTLIIRNRYRRLPCFTGPGAKRPAYQAFRDSLVIIFGEAETARICAHLDGGGGDLAATIDPATHAMLVDNDRAKHDA